MFRARPFTFIGDYFYFPTKLFDLPFELFCAEAIHIGFALRLKDFRRTDVVINNLLEMTDVWQLAVVVGNRLEEVEIGVLLVGEDIEGKEMRLLHEFKEELMGGRRAEEKELEQSQGRREELRVSEWRCRYFMKMNILVRLSS